MLMETLFCRSVAAYLLGFSILACSLAVTQQTDAGTSHPQQQTKTNKKRGMSQKTPFACNAAALNHKERQRWGVLLEHLTAARQETRELSDGYAYRFPAESRMLQVVAEFITYERLCCPFFHFELVVEREGGPLWLRLRGREGVKDFIRSEFANW
jgi:hypothetical protein